MPMDRPIRSSLQPCSCTRVLSDRIGSDLDDNASRDSGVLVLLVSSAVGDAHPHHEQTKLGKPKQNDHSCVFLISDFVLMKRKLSQNAKQKYSGGKS